MTPPSVCRHRRGRQEELFVECNGTNGPASRSITRNGGREEGSVEICSFNLVEGNQICAGLGKKARARLSYDNI